MTAPSPAAPLFIPLTRFAAFGLPGRTKSYALAKLGLLDLVKDGAGRVGVTGDEARRFFSTATPIAEAKRDTAKATAASLNSRSKRESK